MMRAADVAKRIGIQTAKVFEMVRCGEFNNFDGQTFTGAHLWKRETVNQWIEKHPEWITPVNEQDVCAADVCAILGISMTAMYRWIDAGKLPQPALVRRVDQGGNFYGGLMKVWKREDVINIRSGANAKQ